MLVPVAAAEVLQLEVLDAPPQKIDPAEAVAPKMPPAERSVLLLAKMLLTELPEELLPKILLTLPPDELLLLPKRLFTESMAGNGAMLVEPAMVDATSFPSVTAPFNILTGGA